MFGKAIGQRIVRTAAVFGLVVTASLSMTQTASAQFGAMGGSDDVFRPDFTTRDVVLFVEGLNLDEGQRYIFETMFEMYQSDFDSGVEQVRERLAGMRDELVGGDPQEILQRVFAPVDEWRKTKHSLAARLMMDLQSQLSPQQKDMWPAFDRKLRRIKTLKDGVLTGENIDLFFVLQQLDLSPREKDSIQPILDRYEVNLDAALQARNAYVAESQQELSTAIRSQDVQRAKAIVEQQVNYRLTVRNTTEDTLKELMAVLPEERAAALRRATLEQAFGNVFRPTQMERVFEQVLEMEELEPETITAVRDLQSRYAAELAVINERLVQLIRAQDGVKAVERVEKLVHRVSGEAVAIAEDPVRNEYYNREELGNRYMRELRALLTPEQFQKIPGSAKIDGSATNRGTFANRRANNVTTLRATPKRSGTGGSAAASDLGTEPPVDEPAEDNGKEGARGAAGGAKGGDGRGGATGGNGTSGGARGGAAGGGAAGGGSAGGASGGQSSGGRGGSPKR